MLVNATERELWCYAISAKRYVLYRSGPTGPLVVGHGEDRDDVDADPSVWDITKPSQHGLGHLLNPDPRSGSRDWIDEAWRWLIGLDLGLDAVEPEWLDTPAVSQVSVSSPGYWHLFDAWNEGRSIAESVKPFGFMLVAYADPQRASQEVGRLVHPYEPDPRRWLASEWVDLYDPGRTYRIGVRRPDDEYAESDVVYVRTYCEDLPGRPPLVPWASGVQVQRTRRHGVRASDEGTTAAPAGRGGDGSYTSARRQTDSRSGSPGSSPPRRTSCCSSEMTAPGDVS